MILITNGKIVTPDGILNGYDVLIRDNCIAGVVRRGTTRITPEVHVIQAGQGYICPGFIDIHSDYIEHMAAPRPVCMMDIELSLRETERELIAHGITTMFHSLSLYRLTEFGHKPIREPENVRRFIEQIHRLQDKPRLIRHRFHARFEIDYLEGVEDLKQCIQDQKAQLVSFMDHTPGQGQYKDLKIYRDTVKSYGTLADETIDELLRGHERKEKLAWDGIQEIARMAQRHGIAVASHDDDTLEKLQMMKTLGTTISEFPISIKIAKAAQALGMHTAAGAPNILLGGSHSGNLSAAEAIREGCIDILCSDYYPPAMLHAIFEMHRKHGMDLAQMFSMVTCNPAAAVKLDGEIGSIEAGKRADILIIDLLEDTYPAVVTVLVDGTVAFETRYRGVKKQITAGKVVVNA